MARSLEDTPAMGQSLGAVARAKGAPHPVTEMEGGGLLFGPAGSEPEAGCTSGRTQSLGA